MIDENKLKKVYGTLQQGGYTEDYNTFKSGFTGNSNYANRKKVYDLLSQNGANIGGTYEEFMSLMQKPKPSAQKFVAKGVGANQDISPYIKRNDGIVEKSKKKLYGGMNDFSQRAIKQAKHASGLSGKREPVRYTDTHEAITPLKNMQDAERDYAEAVTKDWQASQPKLEQLHQERERLNEALRKRMEEIDNRDGQGFADFMRKSAAALTPGGGLAAESAADMTKYNVDPEYVALTSALRKNQSAIQTLEDVKKGKTDSFWHTFGTTVANGYTFGDGQGELDDVKALMYAKKRLDDINKKRAYGIPLDREERVAKAVMDNTQANDLVQNMYGDMYGPWATAGATTATSVDFFMDIMNNPGVGNVAKATYKGIAGLGVKQLAKKVGDNVVKNVSKNIARGILKATGVLIGAHTAGAYNANTTAVNKTLGMAAQNTVGTAGKDKNGDYQLVDGMNAMKAFLEAERNQVREYGSEAFGELIPGVGKPALKLLEKVGLSKVSNFFNTIGSKEWYKQYYAILEKGGYNGLPKEALEEYEGMGFDALTGHAQETWDSLKDSRTHLDIWLGVGAQSVLLGAVPVLGAGYHVGNYYKFKSKVAQADSAASKIIGEEKWNDLRSQIDATDNKNMASMLDKILKMEELGKDGRDYALRYGRDLTNMRFYNIAAANNAAEGANNDPNVQEQEQAYSEGHDADGEEKHEIQVQAAEAEGVLASMLGVSEDKLDSIDLDSMLGENEELDLAIHDYKNAQAKYQGVMDNAQSRVDAAEQNAIAEVRRRTDKSRGTVRNATIKSASNDLNGGEDYGVFIVSGNIAQNEDGTINISDSDQMILYFDPLTGKIEHSDASRFTSIGEEVDAEQTAQQAAELAKQKAIEETSSEIDGKVSDGSQFTVIDSQGQQHVYEVLADNGDGTASISIDGSVMENVFPSFDELQKLKDDSDKQRITNTVANKQAEREKQKAVNEKYNQITDQETGMVIPVTVKDELGNNKYADAKGVFLIKGVSKDGKKASTFRFVVVDEEGNIIPFFANKKFVSIGKPVSLDEFKNNSNLFVPQENGMEEVPSDATLTVPSTDEGSRGVAPDGTSEDGTTTNPTSASHGASEPELAAPNDSDGKDTNVSENNNEEKQTLTFADGTPIPLDKEGYADLSQMKPEQIAEWLDVNLKNDARRYVDKTVADAKKKLMSAMQIAIKGVNAKEITAYVKAKEKAVAEAQQAYNKAIAILQAYTENQKAVSTKEVEVSGGIDGNDAKKMTPEQEALLNGHNPHQYQPTQESRIDSEGKDNKNSSNGNEEKQTLTFGDGTPVPMLEDGNPDFSKMTAGQTAELYDAQFGEDADQILSSSVADAKKSLDKAKNKPITGKNFLELTASKSANDKAVAEAQAAYDNAKSVSNAYQEMLIDRSLGTVEGRQTILDKAKRKYGNLKNTPEYKDDKAKQQSLWDETVGKVLHRLYDGTSVDVFDPEPRTVEEYVSSNLAPFSLNYEGSDTAKGVKQETGLERKDFAKNYVLAAEGKGQTVDSFVHKLWQNRPPQLESATDQDIRNAVIGLITGNMNAYDMRHVIENNRIAEAEKEIEDEQTAAENAAYQEGQRRADEEAAAEEKDETSDSEWQQDNNALPFSLQDKGKNQKYKGVIPVSESDIDRIVEGNSIDPKTSQDIIDMHIPKTLQRAFSRIAKMMGYEVKYLYAAHKKGNKYYKDFSANGFFSTKYKTIYLALDAGRAFQFVFGHEMVHLIKEKNPLAYKEFFNLAKSQVKDSDWNEKLEERKELYKGQQRYKTDEEFMEEVVADEIGSLISNLNLLKGLALKMSHPLLASVHDALVKIWKSFLPREISTYKPLATYKHLTKVVSVIEKAYVDTAKGTFENNTIGGERFSLKGNVDEANNRFNNEIEDFKNKSHKGLMHLGEPSPILRACGVNVDEITLSPKVLNKKLNQHSLSTDDVKDLVNAIQEPIMVYQHGDNNPNIVVITNAEIRGNKLSIALELDSDGNVTELNNVSSIHDKNVDKEIERWLSWKDGYFENALKWVDKEKVSDWLSSARLISYSQTENNQKLSSLTKIINDFENPTIEDEDLTNNNERVAFSLREKPEPEKKGVGYKVFLLKDGKLYPPMVANPDGAATPVGVWLDADAAPIAGESKTGRPQVKQGGKGTQGGSGRLAYRPGWHLGVIPYALQFNRKDADGNKTLFPKNFVFAEVEYAADVDYQQEAHDAGVNPSGKYQHSLAGLKHLPTDGYYMYRTNPNPETDPWVITGAMKVNRILTRAEQADLVKKAGREPQLIQDGDIVTDEAVNAINQEIANAPKFSIRTYHGSQASFDKFDHSFMGTGEGAQAYGWGTYVSEVEGIAKAYAKQNTRKHRGANRSDLQAKWSNEEMRRTFLDSRYNHVLNDIDYQTKNREKKQSQLDEELKDRARLAETYGENSDIVKESDHIIAKLQKILARGENTMAELAEQKKELEKDLADSDKILADLKAKLDAAGEYPWRNLYTVEIPDDTGDNYIDWDGKVSDNAAMNIAKGIVAKNIDAAIDMFGKYGNFIVRDEVKTLHDRKDEIKKDKLSERLGKAMSGYRGGAVYEDLAVVLGGQKAASLMLKDAGFDGVKVIAQRNTGGNKDGRMNYVIFDEDNAKIVNHTKFSLRGENFSSRLKSAISETDVNPSEAQKQSGNYKKGHIKFGGYDFTIENPKGSERKGVDEDGKEWSVKMHDTYGYIRGKIGKDGDHLDMFINDSADLDNWNGNVYVVDQVNDDGSFDEHKVMYGYNSEADAKKAYLANYSKGWKGLGKITGVDKGTFDKWIQSSDRKTKPFADYSMIRNADSDIRFSLRDEQIHSEQFKDWFGDWEKDPKNASKVVDENGEPLVVYHGTTNDETRRVWNEKAKSYDTSHEPFTVFKREVDGLPNSGLFFNSSENNAYEYGYNNYAVYLNARNPLVIDCKGSLYNSIRHDGKTMDTYDWANWAEDNGYDGVIFKNIKDGVDYGSMQDTTDDYVVFKSNQIKSATDNNGDFSSGNNDIRFSLKDPDKTMFGMHNISVDKLRKAIKQGGFAAPSMGVVDSKNGVYSDYGEITLIPKAEKLDKRKGKNAGTFTADAWTPTYPQVIMRQTKEGKEKLYTDTMLNDNIPKELGKSLLNRWESYINTGSSRPNEFAWQYMFEKGMNPKVTYSKSAYPKSISNKVMKITDNGVKRKNELTKKENGELIKLYNAYLEKKGEGLDDNAVKEIIDYLEEWKANEKVGAFKQSLQRKIDYFKEYGGDINKAQDWAWQDVIPAAKSDGKVNHAMTLYYATIKADSDKKMQADLQKWFDGKLQEYSMEEYLYNGETASGKPKYVPNTVENAVKIMKKQGLAGGYNDFAPGVGVFIAKYAPTANTLAAMKKNKDKLIPSGDERHKEVRDMILDEYNDLARSLTIKPTDAFDDSGTYRMQELADVKPKDLKKYVADNWDREVSDGWVERYNELVDTIKNDYPVYYFETKFMRPYGLDEFEKAIVPKNTPTDVMDALKKAGIDVHTYEGKEDREKVTMDAINDSDDIKFSIRSFGTDIADASDEIKQLMNNEKNISRRIGSRAQAQSRVLATLSRASDEFRRSNRASARSGQDTWEKDRALGYVTQAAYGTGSFLTEDEIEEITSGKVGKGEENFVYLSKDGKTVIKLNNFLMVDKKFRFNEFVDRIKSHNEFAPNDMYIPLGFALNPEGDFCLVLEQPYVDGKPATQEEIDDYLEYHGFDLAPVMVSEDEIGAGWSDGNYEIWDTKPRNVLKDKNGDLHFIDTVIQHTVIDGHNDNLRFSIRNYDFDSEMKNWKKRNRLAEDAKPLDKPEQKEGENIGEYAARMAEYAKDNALWKTAPKPVGYREALEKWKSEHGLTDFDTRPSRPVKADFEGDEDGYKEAMELYKQEKEKWADAPKPSDFNLQIEVGNINKKLGNLRKAMLNQKDYDKRTVSAVSGLVNTMLNLGWGDGLSRGKIERLLSAAKNATGASDVKKHLDNAMNVLVDNYLGRMESAYEKLTSTKGVRKDQSGVIKIGQLDAKGQVFLQEYNIDLVMSDADLQQRLYDLDEDDELDMMRIEAINSAVRYKNTIGTNEADMAAVKGEIDKLQEKEGKTKKDYELLRTLYDKVLENKIDRVKMLSNVLADLQATLSDSKTRAKEFKERIINRKKHIWHVANLDMQGKNASPYDTDNAKKKALRNVVLRTVMSPTYTFEQYLKLFGDKNVNGEGYLYNYFMSEWNDSVDSEQVGKEDNRKALDAKAKDLFGKGTNFMSLIGLDGKKLEETDCQITDVDGEKRTIHLKQGQMLYVYLVNKEIDGAMKLRAMGITESDVAAIETKLDPKVKAMGEWLQDEYLPICQRRYQNSHVRFFGAPMKEVDNYFPLMINPRARNINEDVNQDSSAKSQLAGTTTGAIVTRRVNTIPLDIENADAFAVALNHLNEMEEWTAMLPFRQDINTLLSYTRFRNQVTNLSSKAYGNGDGLWKQFMQCAQIAAGTYKPKVDNLSMDSKISKALGMVSMAKISGRLWTAAKQTLSFPTFWTEASPWRLLWYSVNPLGSYRWAKENMPLYRKRIESMTVGDTRINALMDDMEKTHNLFMSIAKKGMIPNIFVDAITCAVGARAVYGTEYEKLKKLGYSDDVAEDKAVRKAVLSYNKSQQSSEGAFVAPMQVDRTYVSAALSLYKNSNYAYGRSLIEAARGLGKSYKFWGGHPKYMVEQMKRQIEFEDGLPSDVAEKIAKRAYNRAFVHNLGVIFNYLTVVPIAWALGNVVPYLFLGDDGDKKKKYIEEAFIKGFATSVTDDYAIPFLSDVTNSVLEVNNGKLGFNMDGLKNVDLYVNPATADLANMIGNITNSPWSAASNAGLIGVQALIGFNPQTVGSLVQAFTEFDKSGKDIPTETKMAILKAMNAPEANIRDLYMDELGLNDEDAKKFTVEELSERYAERRMNKDIGIGSKYILPKDSYDALIEKYTNSFNKRIQDYLDKMDEVDKKKVDSIYNSSVDPGIKEMIGKKRAKDAKAETEERLTNEGYVKEEKADTPADAEYKEIMGTMDLANDIAIKEGASYLRKKYARLTDEYNDLPKNQQYLYLNQHKYFKEFRDIESKNEKISDDIKKLKEKLVNASHKEQKTIMEEIRKLKSQILENLRMATDKL